MLSLWHLCSLVFKSRATTELHRKAGFSQNATKGGGGGRLNMGWLLVTPPLLFLDSVFQFSLLSVSVLRVFTFALKKRRQSDFHSYNIGILSNKVENINRRENLARDGKLL